MNAVIKKIEGKGVDHIVAFGGGKTLDLGKLLANKTGTRCIIVPSLASTDAPCTSLRCACGVGVGGSWGGGARACALLVASPGLSARKKTRP